MIGLVLADSPRRIGVETARAIAQALPPAVVRVLVFRDAPIAEIVAARSALLGLHVDAASDDAVDAPVAVQLHGSETLDYLRRLRHAMGEPPTPIIKRIHVAADDTSRAIENRMRVFVAPDTTLLLDPGAGCGRAFAWELAVGLAYPFYLSGGLTPDNVAQGILTTDPAGVDVSSGVEASPGRKDHAKLRDFVRAVREADRRRAGSA